MQLAANLSWLYPDLPWAGRFAAAAADGFQAVEILLPYDEPPAWYAEQLRVHGLQLVLFNTPTVPGAGHVGLAAIAGAETEFQRVFTQALALADATGCRRVHCMAGNVAALDRAACDATLLRNLEWALTQAGRHGLTLTLEALNRVDAPGYCYHQPADVVRVLQHFDTPQLRLQFDCYHCVKEALDPVATLQSVATWIGHVQVAGAPHRHEPDLSRDGLLETLTMLPALGYDSWLACEYRPAAGVADGLRWCDALRQRGVLT